MVLKELTNELSRVQVLYTIAHTNLNFFLQFMKIITSFDSKAGQSFMSEKSALAWSSIEEGDEQLDQPNSQTTMELCHACVA